MGLLAAVAWANRLGRRTVVGLALAFAGCGQVFGPKATLGPGAIVRGRGLYNHVITDTNNEQTLELIVRARYGEPSGLVAVASVTANLRTAATTETQFGIGASSNYAGNLVPLSIGATYEENPTISYVPIQGERFAKSVLSPVGLDMLVLLLGIEHAPGRLISILVKQVNGVQNPMDGPPASRAAFEESTGLLARLQDAGQATWTSGSIPGEAAALVIHDYAPDGRETVRDLLRRWSLPASLAERDGDIVLPVRLGVGKVTAPALNVQTRSVYDVIEIAATAVEVPPEHAALGLPDPELDNRSPLRGLLTIRTAPRRPAANVLVAAHHRGYWFYIAADDAPSKLAFRFLQTLIGMRLIEAAPQTLPTLTIPVGR